MAHFPCPFGARPSGRAWPLLLVFGLGCAGDSSKARQQTTIEWEREQYAAGVDETFTATLILRNPSGALDYGTYVTTSDADVVELLPGEEVDPSFESETRRQVDDTDGPQEISLRCAGSGTATITASHEGNDGYVGVEAEVSDTATVTCGGASETTGTTGTTGDTDDDDTTSTGGTTASDTDSVEDTGEPPGTDGSTGGGAMCAMGEVTAPNSRDVTVSGVEISGEITGDAADCPMLLCSFTVTNNRDDYVTFGVLESTPDDEIAPMPIVAAVAAGESREFEVWANDCTTPISLDRTLFIHDEVAGISLGDVPLMWLTSLP